MNFASGTISEVELWFQIVKIQNHAYRSCPHHSHGASMAEDCDYIKAEFDHYESIFLAG